MNLLRFPSAQALRLVDRQRRRAIPAREPMQHARIGPLATPALPAAPPGGSVRLDHICFVPLVARGRAGLLQLARLRTCRRLVSSQYHYGIGCSTAEGLRSALATTDVAEEHLRPARTDAAPCTAHSLECGPPTCSEPLARAPRCRLGHVYSSRSCRRSSPQDSQRSRQQAPRRC